MEAFKKDIAVEDNVELERVVVAPKERFKVLRAVGIKVNEDK